MSHLPVHGHRIEYQFLQGADPGSPVIVFLHEGLGSLAMWKDFPKQIVDATGCDALIYSRYGYGQSDPLANPRRVDYMHDEALLALPQLLDTLNVTRPILLGHSDGGSIALIHAGAARRPVRGLILMAPHVMVEDVAIRNIQAAKQLYETTGLRDKLGRYHADPDSAFRGWNDVWLDPAFRNWNIESYLPRIGCPILAMQGENDEYGTMEQIDSIARLAPDVEILKLPGCGHAPHRDRTAAVIEAARRFVHAKCT